MSNKALGVGSGFASYYMGLSTPPSVLYYSYSIPVHSLTTRIISGIMGIIVKNNMVKHTILEHNLQVPTYSLCISWNERHVAFGMVYPRCSHESSLEKGFRSPNIQPPFSCSSHVHVSHQLGQISHQSLIASVSHL